MISINKIDTFFAPFKKCYQNEDDSEQILPFHDEHRKLAEPVLSEHKFSISNSENHARRVVSRLLVSSNKHTHLKISFYIFW